MATTLYSLDLPTQSGLRALMLTPPEREVLVKMAVSAAKALREAGVPSCLAGDALRGLASCSGYIPAWVGVIELSAGAPIGPARERLVAAGLQLADVDGGLALSLAGFRGKCLIVERPVDFTVLTNVSENSQQESNLPVPEPLPPADEFVELPGVGLVQLEIARQEAKASDTLWRIYQISGAAIEMVIRANEQRLGAET